MSEIAVQGVGFDPAGQDRASRVLASLRRFVVQQPVGSFAALILVLLVLVCALAPWTAPYSYTDADPGARLQSPSISHLAGTDNVSRDVLSRVIWGGRNSLSIGLGAVVLGLLGATCVGLVGGYFGGWVDDILQRITDAMMSIPGLLMVMIIVTILGTGKWQVTLAIAIGLVFPNSRVVRSSVLSVRNAVYVEAATTLGAGSARIVLRHILPNVMVPIIIIATVAVGSAVTIEASLSFLGIGVPPPEPTWGQMLGGRTRAFMLEAPWMALAPGIALSLLVFSANMVGDALRDTLDPRLRM